MNSTLRQFLLQEASQAILMQGRDGSMPAGHNGPYFHRETPLRNTCHWLVLWCHSYAWTSEQRFLDAASLALSFILLPAHRPSGANWLQRTTKHRDRCNGLIGAAWVIEALTCANRILESERAFSSAEEVFALHPFDERLGIWRRLEVDGMVLPIDRTFNHQLWFAASAARLSSAGSDIATSRVTRFINKLPQIFAVYRDGLIVHRIRLKWWDRFFEPWSPLHNAYAYYDQLRQGKCKPLDAHKRDIGYHAFNLHAFAVLHRFYPQHPFWQSSSFRRTLQFSRSSTHAVGVDTNNHYAYPYNPVGFEMALALGEFLPEALEERREWIRRQIAFMTRMGTTEYGDGAADPVTARARIYEAAEIEELTL